MDAHEHDFAAWPFTDTLDQRRLWSTVCGAEDLGCFDSPEEAADAIKAHITELPAPAVAPAPSDVAPAPASEAPAERPSNKTTRSERNSDRAEGAPAAPGTDGSA